MPELLGRSAISELLEAHQIVPSKGLGQNFVVDPNTIHKMVRLAEVGPDDLVVEIGPGLGSLTVALAAKAARVVAIERDKRVLPALAEVLDRAGVSDRVEVVAGDALDFAWLAQVAGPFRIVANLPYNLAAPIVLEALARAQNMFALTVMIQREVAERLAAEPGDSAMGVPSAKRAYWAKATVAMNVSRSVFVPQPHVDSSVLHVLRRPPADDPTRYERVATLIETAFRGRRKMLRASLAGVASPASFVAADIDPTQRAERLSAAQWCRLARAIDGEDD